MTSRVDISETSSGVQTVYNLTPLQFGLSNIALRRLKVARFTQLNDPFELLAVDLVDSNLRAGIIAKKYQIDSHEGLLCFSKSWRNPLLWSHYADSHRGVALGFDVPTNLLVGVRYIQGLEKLKAGGRMTPQAEMDAFLHKLRFTKFDGWRYEDEVRQFFKLADLTCESNLHFVPFSNDLVLKEVVLGPRCEVPIEAVGRLVAGFPNKVHVVRARIAYTKFAVTEGARFRPLKDVSVAESQTTGGGIASLLP
jgi:hypothetical protein